MLIYFRANIASAYFSHDFKVPVKIGNVYLSTNRLVFQDFIIENPPKSNSEYALYAKQVSVNFKISELFKKVTTLESITFSHVHLWVELYNKSGSDNNWASFFRKAPPLTSEKTPTFLIKTLKFKQLSPVLVQSSGYRKKGFAIGELSFHNISNNNHYANASIERAIMDSLMPATFKSLAIENLMPTLETSFLEQPFVPFYGR